MIIGLLYHTYITISLYLSCIYLQKTYLFFKFSKKFFEGFTDGEFYIYPEKAIGFFISQDVVMGVMVGKQGYFDYIKNKTGPASWRRF